VVAADIEESAKSAVVPRTTTMGSPATVVETIVQRLHLFGARDQLPRFTEYAQTLEFGVRGSVYHAAGMVEACESGARSS